MWKQEVIIAQERASDARGRSQKGAEEQHLLLVRASRNLLIMEGNKSSNGLLN